MNPQSLAAIVSRAGRYLVKGSSDEDIRNLWFLLHDNRSEPRSLIKHFEPGKRLVIAPEAPSRFQDHTDKVRASWTTSETFSTDISENINYLDSIFSKFHRMVPKADFRVLGHGEGAHVAWHWLTNSECIPNPSHFVIWDGFTPRAIDWQRSKVRFLATKLLLMQENHDTTISDRIRTLQTHMKEANIPCGYRPAWKKAALFNIDLNETLDATGD